MSRILLLFLAVLALFASGCSGSPGPLVPAQGVVKISDGRSPPAGTTLVFNPAEGRTGTASATTAADGSFVVTHVSGAAGIQAGKYTVEVRPPADAAVEFGRMTPWQAATDALFVEVEPDTSVLVLTLPRRK